jgi:D-arabinitol dehydrogenase (NADP+)
MRAAQISSPGQISLANVEIPELGPEDVLIRIRRAGVCGTDIHILHGSYPASYPLIPGHEFSGTVEMAGTSVTRFRVGDRVTADPNIACNRCEHCQRNQPNQCLNWQGIGVTRAGGFADYVSVPEGNVYSIGEISFEDAAFIEPLACVVWGIQVVRPSVGDRALVFGAGPMGCLVMQNLKAVGATEVTIADPVQSRLEKAASLGADRVVLSEEAAGTLGRLAPHGFDIVVDATGLPSVVERCFDYVRARGKVWLFGVCPPDAKVSFSPYQAFRNDLSIYGSYAVNRTFNESIELIRSGTVQVSPLLSHSLPLKDFVEGMQVAEHNPKRMKVQFDLS